MKITLLITSLVIAFTSISQNALFIPPTITSTNINLTLQTGITQFYSGVDVNTLGANGSLLGPTLIMNQGDNVNIMVDNQLADTTTIHWHGMHVSPENDGGPHTTIAPNTIWNPQFTVLDKAGLFWYHPHLHMQTNKHVSRGIAGMIIVKDAEEAALTLPRTYGIDDFPMIIQSKGFDATGEIEWMGHIDSMLLVNGTVDPFLNAPAQMVRFRILNGSSQRVYKLGLTNNQPFQLIGTDGGLLNAPVQLTRYQIAPGQRADVLVDLSALQGQSIQFMNYGTEIGNAIYGSSQPGMAPFMTLPGYSSNPLNGNDFVILDINVQAPTASPVTTTPTTLTNIVPLVEGTQQITRALTFTSQNQIAGPFLINGSTFNHDVVDYTVPLGNREIWTLTNQTPIAHPFHIHDVQFQILDINGATPPPELQGLNDVVLVPAGQGTVRFIADFLDFANDTIPYMFHCHMLQHEDQGMMGQFLVVNTASIEELGSLEEISIYPNPSSGNEITIKVGNYNGEIVISDAGGRIIKRLSVDKQTTFNLTIQSGVYFLKDSFGRTTKFVVR